MYLVFYNLMQFVLFTYILVVMGIRFMKEGGGKCNNYRIELHENEFSL